MILARPTQFQAGSTLAETVVAATLVGAFFVTIFEVNAICLRYIDASKECVAAVQGVQDRVEGLRNLAFTDLISPSYMMNPRHTHYHLHARTWRRGLSKRFAGNVAGLQQHDHG